MKSCAALSYRDASGAWGGGKDGFQNRQFSCKLSGERRVIEASVLGRDRDRLGVRERDEVREFCFAKCGQRHDWDRADFETRNCKRRELDAIGKLDHHTIAVSHSL